MSKVQRAKDAMEEFLGGVDGAFTLEQLRVEMVNAAMQRTSSCHARLWTPVHTVGKCQDTAVWSSNDCKGIGYGVSVVICAVGLPLV